MEEQKREIIQAINNIRREVGLEPYDTASLQEMDVKKLENLYRRQLVLKGSLRKKEKPGFKLNLKTRLLIGIPVIGVISFLILSSLIFPELSETIKIIFLQQGKLGIRTSLGFMYNSENCAYFILLNTGNAEITSFNLTVDNQIKNYEITLGNLPLSTNQYLYFRTPMLYDNEIHLVKVTINERTIKELRIKGNSTIPNATQPGVLIP